MHGCYQAGVWVFGERSGGDGKGDFHQPYALSWGEPEVVLAVFFAEIAPIDEDCFCEGHRVRSNAWVFSEWKLDFFDVVVWDVVNYHGDGI